MSGSGRGYLSESRRLTVGLVAVLPLLAAYEIGILLARSQVENHAGLLVKRMIAALGVNVYAGLTGGVAVCFFLALMLKRWKSEREFRGYGLMLAEAAVYGLVLGPLVLRVQAWLADLSAAAPAPTAELGLRVLLYTGAGVWEELVFRLGLLGSFTWFTTRVLKGDPVVFGVLGLLLTGAAFSMFHHLGNMAEPFEPRRFAFRTLAGVALGLVYLWRGLGVCVYTHAFYNVAFLLMSESGDGT